VARRRSSLVVLDDDPTGAQAVTGVPVVLDWTPATLRQAAAGGPPSVYVITNHRALPPARAREIVLEAARAAVDALPEWEIFLRGDSTLRAHLREEYLGLRDATFPGRDRPLLLVPALPAAGRITVDGVHLLERDGSRTPLHETEYARDPAFAYSSARLLRWAEERSGGYFPAAAGVEVHLAELRSRGAAAVAEALGGLEGRAAVCAPDAETLDDLQAIGAGLELAEAAGVRVVVRSAPTFVGVFAGNLATGFVEPPTAQRGLLVVCGSYVPTTTRQLGALLDERPGSLVEVHAVALAGGGAEREVERAAREAEALLRRNRLAVVATPRERPEGTETLEAGERIAANLARVVAALEGVPDVVLAKGGITSAVTVRAGLGAASALVVGPVADGIALWQVTRPGGQTVPFLVFPGNVGSDRALAELVARILGSP
jgi:uncharacterized protein YgbK (DUF1537 family)